MQLFLLVLVLAAFLSGLLIGDAKWFVSVMVSNNLNVSVQGFVSSHFQTMMMALDTQLFAMVGHHSDVMFMVCVQSFSGCDDGNRHPAVCHSRRSLWCFEAAAVDGSGWGD